MNQTLTVRNVIFGAGKPKICIPLVGRTLEDVRSEAAALQRLPADLAEWRMDCFDAIGEPDAFAAAAAELRRLLPDLPLLFTFRTKQEGGAREEITQTQYRSLCLRALDYCDLLDVELFSGDALVRELIDAAHARGVAVVVSSHDFSTTPPVGEMLERLQHAQALGADLPKLAVMPRNAHDVLALLEATLRFHETGTRPAVTMAMSQLGAISRVAGEVFGSCMTFGAAAQASAPGQIPAGTLAAVLDALH